MCPAVSNPPSLVVTSIEKKKKKCGCVSEHLPESSSLINQPQTCTCILSVPPHSTPSCIPCTPWTPFLLPWHFQLLQKPSFLVESAAAMVLACMLGWVRGRTAKRFLLMLLLQPLHCLRCICRFPSLSFSLAHRFTPVHE